MAGLTLDWLHFVILLGAVQGVFLTMALASKRSNRTANRLLAAAMFVFSIGMASAVYHAAGLVDALPHFFGVGYPLPFLYGPLVYLYAVAAADRGWRLRARDVLHLAPFVVTVVAGLPFYLMSGAGKVAFWHRLQAGDAPLLIVIADPLKYVSGVAYTIATLLFLRRHRERVKESYSSIEHLNLRWLLWLGASAAAIWLLAVVIGIVQGAGMMRLPRGDDYISLAVAALVYGIGYRGLRQPEIFRFETAEFPVPAGLGSAASGAQAPAATSAPLPDAAGPPPVVAPANSDSARYERSGLTAAEARRLKASLLDLMDRERPWLSSDLTLAELAGRLNTTPHKLSEVLNAEVGQTFYDFVNGYRVREVQRRIEAGEARARKILSLALDAGFASKSTFNEVFKKHTSQTPSDFRQAAGA